MCIASMVSFGNQTRILMDKVRDGIAEETNMWK